MNTEIGMNTAKMDRVLSRIFKGFVIAAVVGGVSFGVMVWGSVQVYKVTAQYLEDHHFVY